MKRKVKEKWVAALRSGEYEQGRLWLKEQFEGEGKKGLRYCCLGVLCEVTYPRQFRLESQRQTLSGISTMFEFGNIGRELSHEIPDEYLNKLRLSDEVQQKLIMMNDSEEFSFNLIADWIERFVETED